MCKIAMCVPTCNHPMVIEDILNKSIEDYNKLNIDIYYFDSSKDEETKKVIDRFVNKGYENLYYKKCSLEESLYDKLKKIMEDNILDKEYDYIWPVKDRSYCPKATLEKIITIINKCYDVIFLGVVNTGENKIYLDKKEFYREWGWLCTSLDVLIFKKTFLNINHEKSRLFGKKYNQSWYTYVIPFFLLEEVKDTRICALCDSETQIYNSPLGKSTWEKNVFQIWKDDWIQSNDNLPSCYDEYKDEVIKYAASLPWILGGISRLTELHQKGILTEENYDTVIENWERVSDIPRETVKEIAYGIYDKFHDVSSINVHSEITSLLIQLIRLLRTGKMKKEQIPFDNISKCIQSEILSANRYSEELLNSVIGSVTDVLNFARSENSSTDDVVRYMQMMINFIELSK